MRDRQRSAKIPVRGTKNDYFRTQVNIELNRPKNNEFCDDEFTTSSLSFANSYKVKTSDSRSALRTTIETTKVSRHHRRRRVYYHRGSENLNCSSHLVEKVIETNVDELVENESENGMLRRRISSPVSTNGH